MSLPDGRKLGYLSVGKGKPAVYFHGTGSSRLEVQLLKEFAQASNLQLIGVDRPGYGLSTYKLRENLTDFGDDLSFLLGALGFDRVGVLGWSGGGVFALAYLAHCTEQVTRAVVASTPDLPFDASTAHNTPLARYAMKIPHAAHLAIRNMRRQVLKANGDTQAFLKSATGKQMLHACSSGDLKFFRDPDWMGLLYESMVEAFRQGNLSVKAVVEEHRLFLESWSIPFQKVPADRLFIWQGAEDKTCRVNNGYQIAQKMIGAHLEVFAGEGHCVLFSNLEKLRKIFS